MANPTKFTWVDPTVNTDGSAITAGEITGYSIGVRPSTGIPGTYPIVTPIASPTATSEPFASLSSVLAPGTYAAAIQSVGPTNSAWSSEVTFTIVAPIPSAPTGLAVS
jgi:hypothetical protein